MNSINSTNSIIGLGSNLGEREIHLKAAIKLLNENPSIVIQSVSSLYESEPLIDSIEIPPASLPPFEKRGERQEQMLQNVIQADNEKWYLNAIVIIESILLPLDLLKYLQYIENKRGRKRLEHWGARTLDLDILFYGNQIMSSSELIIPHPEIQNRKFVLMPLNEIASDFIHPILQKSILDLLKICEDTLIVRKIKKNW